MRERQNRCTDNPGQNEVLVKGLPVPQLSSSASLGASLSSTNSDIKKKRIIRFTVDYTGTGRYIKGIMNRSLIINIIVRDQNDVLIKPRGKISAYAFPYKGRHRKTNEREFPPNRSNQINLDVTENLDCVGQYRIDWKPDAGKYELFIIYNNNLIGFKKYFIVKIAKRYKKYRRYRL